MKGVYVMPHEYRTIVQAEFLLPKRVEESRSALPYVRPIVRFFDTEGNVGAYLRLRNKQERVLADTLRKEESASRFLAKSRARFLFKRKVRKAFEAEEFARSAKILQLILIELRGNISSGLHVAIERPLGEFLLANDAEFAHLYGMACSAVAVCIFLFQSDDLCAEKLDTVPF
jgi:hypothetical protein